MNLDSLAAIHSDSYSKACVSYMALAETLKETRTEILSYVLFGKNEERFTPISFGPHQINKPSLLHLDTTSRILDVGCGAGDNLAIMFENGFTALTGIDIAPRMTQEAKTKVCAEVICDDVLHLVTPASYDLVFAQAFIHLFPKDSVKEVMMHLLNQSLRRFYFSTTIHETPGEGMEPKGDVMRYRSRYTLQEILKVAKGFLASDCSLSFHYFLMSDPLGKLWINGIFERHDIKKIYDDDGVLLYKRLYAPEEIEIHQKELEQMKDSVPEPGTILRYDAPQVFDRVENFIPHCSGQLQALFTSTHVMRIVSTLLGEEPILLKDKLNYKLPGAKEFVPHQDAAAGWHQYGDRHLTFALAMDEACRQNGALYFAPGEHKKGLLSPLKTPLPEETVKRLQWSITPTKPGDALFFDSYAPHYSEANRSPKARKMTFLTYIAKRYGDHRQTFFTDKRKRQPPIDERSPDQQLHRDQFGKLVCIKEKL